MVRLVLGLAAAVLAVVFALLPVDQQTVEYVWDPGDDGLRVPLLLIERVPDALELSFPCELLEQEDDRQLFVSSRTPEEVPALTVRGGQGQVSVGVPQDADEPGGTRIGPVLDVDAVEDCEVEVAFDRSARRLVVAADSADGTVSVPVGEEAFVVTGLHWAADPAGVRARIETTPLSAIRNSFPQQLALTGVLVLAAAAALSLLRSARQRRLRPGWWRLAPSEWSMLAVAVLVSLVDLPKIDDGRILWRMRHVAGTEMPGNLLLLIENRLMPQRWLYEWLVGTFAGWSNVMVVLRSFSIVFVVAAWILIRRHVLPALAAGRPSSAVVATSWTVHAVFVVAWSATLRPEPLLILLATVVLATTASWPARPRAWPYFVVSAAIGLAVATHVAGLLVAFAGVPVLARLWRDLKDAPVAVLTGGVWGGVFSVIALFLGSNLAWTRLGAAGFGDRLHGYGPLDLYLYWEGIENSAAPMMFGVGLAVIAGVVLMVSAIGRLERTLRWPTDAVVVGAALAPLGLLFTPSKWLWHLAILGPVAVVGWALIAVHVEQRRTRRLAPLMMVAATLGLMMAWSLRPAWRGRHLTRWDDTALRHVTDDVWSSRAPWLFGQDVRWWLWVLLLSTLVMAAWAAIRRRRPERAQASGLAGGLLMCFVVASSVQLAPPVADALVAGGEWTFVRQSVGGIVSEEARCGVPTATPALADAGFTTDDRIAGHSHVYMFAPCHEPMAQRDGVWQVAPLALGGLTNDQRRAGLEYGIDLLTCNSFPEERSGDHLCFFSMTTEGEPLAPSTVQWSRARAPTHVPE